VNKVGNGILYQEGLDGQDMWHAWEDEKCTHILVERLEEMKRRWEDNIKMDVRDTRCKDADWTTYVAYLKTGNLLAYACRN
jgi:hypothetical protein